MLLVTLALLFTAATTAVLIYAVRTAAEGREDETGFHYVGVREQAPHTSRSADVLMQPAKIVARRS